MMMCNKCLTCKIIWETSKRCHEPVSETLRFYQQGMHAGTVEKNNLDKSEPSNSHPRGIFVPCGRNAYEFLVELVVRREIK